MAENDHKLDWITEGQRLVGGRGYSRFVKAMRFILPLAAIALTAIIVLWPDMEEQMNRAVEEKFLPEADQARGELLNPRFDSTDSSNQPFTVTAARAVQDDNNPALMNLDQPTAEIHLNSGETMMGEAMSGIYEQEANKLALNGKVVLTHATGHTLKSEELRIDIKTGQAFSDKDVHVAGDMGTIEARGLEADNNAGILVFKGPATLVLNNAGSLSLDGVN